jgi:hypothetical protein
MPARYRRRRQSGVDTASRATAGVVQLIMEWVRVAHHPENAARLLALTGTSCHAAVMASKYDLYWLSRLDDLRAATQQAAQGAPVPLPVFDLAAFGLRASWYGTAAVQGRTVLESSMAHVDALAKIVAHNGLCMPAQAVYRFTISSKLVLTVERDEPWSSSHLETQVLQGSQYPKRSALAHAQDNVDDDAEELCQRIHMFLESLPMHAGPETVSFDNGLYFFYESGEISAHSPGGRVVRVGNHPRAENRLRGRLRDHYRTRIGAKNGSVFRRYLGGALIRQTDPASSCLAPSPGRGHWERQQEQECPTCEPVEIRVSERLRGSFSLRCVRIDDREERNRFEAHLIASLAACKVCHPSASWLGRYAYPPSMQESGLWNTEFVGSPGLTSTGLKRFEELVRDSLPQPPSGPLDLSRTLLIIPCSGGKDGRSQLGLHQVAIEDLVNPNARRVLAAGRELAFRRKGTTLELGSPRRSALEYYSGQPYSTRGVRTSLVDAIGRGLHCLIISGGYGVVRAEEPIHKYQAHLGTQTRSVWARRLPEILQSYVQLQGITHTLVLLSQQYAACVPELTSDERRFVPTFSRDHDQGPAVRVVPAKIGEELRRVLDAMVPLDPEARR